MFGEGVEASDFNRFKLGRVLERCYNYGTEFSEIALNVCRQENVDTCFNSEDTTSFVVYGDYATSEQEVTNTGEVTVKHGYSKAHRPDLKQVMLEMMVSQDIPLLGRCLSGNASDNVVFKERSEKLIKQFKESETPRYLIADSKLYTEKHKFKRVTIYYSYSKPT